MRPVLMQALLILRRIFRYLGIALLGLVALALLAFGAIQTGPGKSLLAHLGSTLASTAGMQVTISDIGGFVPSDMTIGSIELSDTKGPFAQIENARLVWSPRALFTGTLDIATLEAATVRVLRNPELPPAPPAEADSGNSFALPIRIARFAIADIAISEPVIGHAANLSLQGSADLSALAHGLSLDFALERRDAPGKVTGTANYELTTRQLDLDIVAQEPAGGLIARAAGMEGLPELNATLKGAGSLHAWDGRLSLTAGTIAQIEGVAGIRVSPQGHRVTFAVDADIARLLPANIAPLFEARTEVAGAALIDDQRLITIQSFTARAAGFNATATGTLDADNIADTAFTATTGDSTRFSALAPGVMWRSTKVNGTLKGTLDAPTILARLTVEGLSGAGYGSGTLAATMRTAPDAMGNLAIAIEGDAQGLTAADPKVASALGTNARFSAAGTRPIGGEPALTALNVHVSALSALFSGRADQTDIKGDLHIERLDLTAFSPLADRTLAGRANLDVKIDASTDFSRANLGVKGGVEGLHTGIAQVDSLFGRAATLDGTVARDGENALSISDLKLNTEGLALNLNGRIATTVADLTVKLALDNLTRLDPRLTGALSGDAAFSGTLEDLGVKARLSIPEGTAMGKQIQALELDVTATDITGKLGGDLRLTGNLAGKMASGTGALATASDGTRRVDGLDIAIGSVTAKGDISIDPNSLATGRVIVVAGNLADLSVLTLTEMSGKLDADVSLDVIGGKQRIAVKANADKVVAVGQTLDLARVDAVVVDPTGIPMLDGTADLKGINASGVVIESAAIKAVGGTAGTDLTVDAVAQGTTIKTAGRLSQQGGGILLRLDRLALTRSGTSVTTSAPANITLIDKIVSVDRLALAAGGGTAIVSGKAGETLDLTVDLRGLPLSLADLAAPGLNLSGTLSGNARIAGTASVPSGNYDLRIARMSSPDLARQGAGPFDIAANGALSNGRVGVRATITGPNLQGLTITGSAPIAAGEFDLAIRGSVNLAIVNPMLATSGARIDGTAVIDGTIRGTASAPLAGGTVRVSNGKFDDALNGVSLTGIAAVLTGTQRSVTITSFSAKTSNGGGLTGRGTIALDPAAGFPGRIEVDLNNAGLINSDLMRLVAEGKVAVEGAFLNGPRVTGRMIIRALDINIPDRFPGGVQDLQVRHVNDRRNRTARGPAPRPAAAPNAGIALNLVVSAPNNNVFVRGLGMEAELGGEITVTGTTGAPVTLGAFELRRGNFDILGRRLTFTRGRIAFTGTTDPELDFIAETSSTDVTAKILVTGPASKPEISFTSTPTLPQDEVLSRLMFGRSAGSLTAGQALQVAQTIAQFSGGSGMLDSMRRSLGVDSLDVGTDAAGTGGQVGIGKRLNDNIYLGVRQGTTSGSSRVTVDVDITKNLRLQGATGADGSAEVGIGAQWDY